MRNVFSRKPALAEERRQALEQWAWLRLELLRDDPMIAIIGAVGRLTKKGMDVDAATDLVLGILREAEPLAP
jgi:hypothetical protein